MSPHEPTPLPALPARHKRPTRWRERGASDGAETSVIKPQEIRALLQACPDTPTGLRDQALITLAWRNGLRMGEMLALRPEDLDLDRGTLVVTGRSGRRRDVVLHPEAVSSLRRWLQRRNDFEVRPNSPLLCALSGRKLNNSYFGHLFIQLSRQAGLQRRFHVEALRRRFALDRVEAGSSEHEIGNLMGHTSPWATRRYLRQQGLDESWYELEREEDDLDVAQLQEVDECWQSWA
jgi:integrase/recombinase XerD